MSLLSKSLSGYQILNCFNSDTVLSNYNCEVIPINYFSDFKNDLPKNNFCICYNTLHEKKPGVGHWCLVLFNNDKNLCHFDSLNNSIDNRVLKFLENVSIDYGVYFQHNNIKLQRTYSNLCGHLCLYMSYYLSRNVPFTDIIKRFESYTYDEIEYLIVEFTKTKFNIW